MPKTTIWTSIEEIRNASLVKNADGVWELSAGYTIVAQDGETKGGSSTVVLPTGSSNQVEALITTQLRKVILAKELNE